MDSSIARDRLSYVVKPDSTTTSQGDFLATHVAIKRLHLLSRFDIMPTGGKDYSEEAVYQKYVLNPGNKHQFIAVYGQSGTGKSHLIRWFEAKFQNDKPENEVVLFIRRSDNTLKGTIRQLLETTEVKEIANKEVYDRLVRASVCEDENKLKGRIYHDFINEVECDNESHHIRLTNVRRKRLTAFLYNEVVQAHLMSIDGPIERIYSKVAENSSVDRDTIAQFVPEDFFVSPDLFENIHRAGADPKAEKMARELMADESGTEDAQKIAAYLNQFVNDVIQRCAGIEPGDFRDIFQDIRSELYRMDKNLTLFIEDVTSFTGVDDALLDALMVAHTGTYQGKNLCRISSIVGTTSNYLARHFLDNYKERITQYVFIPSDAFDENGIFEFVGRYLNTMSLPEDRIALWMKNHATAAEYPVHDVKEGAAWEFIPIENDKKQVVGRALPNGLVKDASGSKVVAKMVRAGSIIGYGCNRIGYLDKDGKIKKGNEETNYKITPEGIVLDAEGRYIGETLKTGRVFDNECNFLGTVDNAGIVKDLNNRYVGCVNPDGSVLNEKGEFIGSVGRTGAAVDLNGKYLGEINMNNIVINEAKLPVGCVGLLGDVFNSKGVYIGRALGERYAYSSSGEYINRVDNKAKVRIYGKPSASLSANNLVLDENNKILGVAVPSQTTVVGSDGKIIGRLFPDGQVYDSKGVAQGVLKNGGLSSYNNIFGAVSPAGEVMDLQGRVIGVAVDGGAVFSRYGDSLGKVNAKGEFFNQRGEYQGAVVTKGAAIGYDGSYIGYAAADGRVLDLEGKVVASATHDRKVLNTRKEVVGEVIPEGIMIDAMGNYKGLLNSLGDVVDLNGQIITAVLPGGSSDKNLNLLRLGFVIDFGGNIIGAVAPDGSVASPEGVSLGKVLPDGNVLSVSGKLIGEKVFGDIIISNDDKVVGYVNFDGKIIGKDATIIGRVLSGGLAIDLNDRILGRVYPIGATILGNDGQYKGRLAHDGSVIDVAGNNIGYVKNNGSFIDLDKKVSGYVLGEVAKNRRN